MDGWERDKDETQRACAGRRGDLGYGNKMSESYLQAKDTVQWIPFHEHQFSPAVTETQNVALGSLLKVI